MAAWITSSAPTSPNVVGSFSYVNGFEIAQWHLIHGSYAGDDISARWGPSPSLVLGVERGNDKGVRWKKEIKQCRYTQGTTQLLETTTFWLPVLVEGDPILWDIRKTLIANAGFTGTNTNATVQNVFHLPLIATATTVRDVLRVGSAPTTQYLDTHSPQLNTGVADINPGRHVARFGGFDYYWEDTAANPHFVRGTVSTKGQTVVSSTPFGNPYSNTVFVGNPSGYSPAGRKVSQLYEYSVLEVRGKQIRPGMPFTGTGTPSANYVYSQFAISVGKLSSDPDSFSGKVPIVVLNTDYQTINSWKTASGTIPQKPSSTALYPANGTVGLPAYISSYATKWAESSTADGFTVHQTTGWPDWTASSPSISLGIGKWMVYPRYWISSGVKTARTNDAAKANFAVGTGGVSFPTKGKHFGVFDNVTDANSWASYYNSILDSKSISVKEMQGFVFVAGPNWSDNWSIGFNPDGISGIISQNSLLSNTNQNASPTIGNVDSEVEAVASDVAGGSFRVTMQYAVNTVTKSNVNTLIKQLMANEKLSFKQTKDKFIEEFIKARTAFQISQGKTPQEARAIATSRADVIFASATPNSNAGGTGSTSAAPPAATIRIPIVRGLIGYQPPPSALGDSPQLVQKYQYVQLSANGNGAEVQDLVSSERRFIFPFTPKDVTYSNLSSVWTEINRTGRHPIVDWTGFQLLKVSFTFELVSRNSTDIAQPRDGFGLYFSIDEEINLLRQMATAPYPVSFLNMDTFFSKELRYPLYTQGRGVEFVITDFAVQSVQRTPTSNSAGATSIQPNQISRASCTITLQECPIESVDIISIPKITVCSKKDCPPPTCKEPCTEKPREFVLFAKDQTQRDTPVVQG